MSHFVAVTSVRIRLQTEGQVENNGVQQSSGGILMQANELWGR